MKRLKTSVVEKFQDTELSDQQYAQLAERFGSPDDYVTESEVTGAKTKGRGFWGYQVAAVMVVAMVTYFASNLYQHSQLDSLIDSIAEEVVSNHINLKPPEIESAQLSQVFDYFDRLAFELVNSTAILDEAGDRLLGGRYCSIQGIDAAQLHIVSSEGDLRTLYQGVLPEEKLPLVPDVLAGEEPALRIIRGVQVEVWQEQGVVFARASN